MKKSNRTIQSGDNFTKVIHVSQTYTQQEIDENIRLLREYYKKYSHSRELLKRHVYYLYHIKGVTPTELKKISGFSRPTIYEIIGKGGDKRD